MTVGGAFTLLAPYVVPILLAGITAAVAPAFTTARRLRTDLSTDADLLAKLPPAARAELRADVRRRSFMLVAVSRYPPLTRNDLLAITGCVVGLTLTFLTAHYAPSQAEADPTAYFTMGVLISAGITFICWFRFYSGWSDRAQLRLAYVERHVDAPAAADMALGLRMANVVSSIVPAFLHWGGLSYLTYRLGRHVDPAGEYVALWLLLATLLPFLFVSLAYGKVIVGADLARHLLEYHPELGPELRRRAEGDGRDGGHQDARASERPVDTKPPGRTLRVMVWVVSKALTSASGTR